MKPSSIARSTAWRCFSSRLLAIALLPVLGAGCAGTFQEVKALSPQKALASRPTALVIGHVEITDARVTGAEKELYRLKFQQGVEAWLSKTNAFESIISGTNVPPQSVVLTGTINEVNPGNAAARFWVGMGAGQARIQGDFDIKDATDQSLEKFTARRSYLGGIGGGGLDMIKMDDLMFRLGQTVGESINKWLHGQKLD